MRTPYEFRFPHPSRLGRLLGSRERFNEPLHSQQHHHEQRHEAEKRKKYCCDKKAGPLINSARADGDAVRINSFLNIEIALFNETAGTRCVKTESPESSLASFSLFAIDVAIIR